MNILEGIKSVFSGNLVKDIADIIDDNRLSKEEKENLLHSKFLAAENTVVETVKARMSVIVAELQQSDKYTKRARPSVVYMGLLFMLINHVLAPTVAQIVGADWKTVELPAEFWMAWGSVVSVWAVGRTAEKIGYTNKFTNIVTGNKSVDEIERLIKG